MERQEPIEPSRAAEVLMDKATQCYEEYVYLVKCATVNPDEFELYPEGYEVGDLDDRDSKDYLATHLDAVLRRSLKNVIVKTREALGIPENIRPGSDEFIRLKKAVDAVIESADLSSFTDEDNPWWGELGPPNPLRFPLNIYRVPNERRHRVIPRDELLDNRSPHPAIASRQ